MKRQDENGRDPQPPSCPKALIVDDEPHFRESLRALVEREGFEVETVGTLADARARLANELPDVVLVDIKLPDGNGLDLVRDDEVAARSELVVVTGHGSVESAVEVLRAGSLDYLTKPLDRGRLKSVLTNVARTRALKEEVSALRGELRELGRCGRLVGRSKPMQEVYDLIERVAKTDATVLVSGESGTGKELAAETIHQLSPRRKAPFLPLNCTAVSPNLIESELFGHEKGSFTGADRQRRGFFEQASRGTLFLDEITEMPAELQAKLLRVLETGTFMRVGGSESIEVDVRVIAATNRNPVEAVEKGRLRDDLYYRLNVFPIALPPLRSRDDDMVYLAEHFLEELNRRHEESKRWSRAALRRLCGRPWPGNVRELKNAVHRAFILSEEEIGPDAIPEGVAGPPALSGEVLEVRVGSSIEEVERRLILATLEETGGDKRKAARTLGVSLKTLYNRLNVYNARNGGS